jgi:hypothetical protein
MGDAVEEEATDLNGRILGLVERGKRKEAIRLYYEVLGCDIKVAEAAIDELAKDVEFEEARPATTPEPRLGRGWFSGWLNAIKTVVGRDRG